MPDTVAAKSRKSGKKGKKGTPEAASPTKGKARDAKGKGKKAKADASEESETSTTSSVGELVAALGGKRTKGRETEPDLETSAEARAETSDEGDTDEGDVDEPGDTGESAEGETDEPETVDVDDDAVSEARAIEADAPAEGAMHEAAAPQDAAELPSAGSGTPQQVEAEGAVQLDDALPMDPDDDLRDVEGEASPRLVSIVESLLFAASKPMTVRELRAILKEPTVRQVQLALKHLLGDTRERGIVLAQGAGGFRLRTHADNARWVQQLMAGKPVRLSRSQLEVLAVIAYRQPITKAEVDHVRGVDCGAVLKVLLERELIRFVGRKEEPGRPHLYGTTYKFLEFFNLRSLRDMPALHEFRELTEESRAELRTELGDEAADLAEEREAMGQELLDFGDDGTPGTTEGESSAGESSSDGEAEDGSSSDEDAGDGGESSSDEDAGDGGESSSDEDAGDEGESSSDEDAGDVDGADEDPVAADEDPVAADEDLAAADEEPV